MQQVYTIRMGTILENVPLLTRLLPPCSHPPILAFYYIPNDQLFGSPALLTRIGLNLSLFPLRLHIVYGYTLFWVIIFLSLMVDFCGPYVWIRLCMYSRSLYLTKRSTDLFIHPFVVSGGPLFSGLSNPSSSADVNSERQDATSKWLSSSQMLCILLRCCLVVQLTV